MTEERAKRSRRLWLFVIRWNLVALALVALLPFTPLIALGGPRTVQAQPGVTGERVQVFTATTGSRSLVEVDQVIADVADQANQWLAKNREIVVMGREANVAAAGAGNQLRYDFQTTYTITIFYRR